jgi:hypothetical protein
MQYNELLIAGGQNMDIPFVKPYKVVFTGKKKKFTYDEKNKVYNKKKKGGGPLKEISSPFPVVFDFNF